MDKPAAPGNESLHRKRHARIAAIQALYNRSVLSGKQSAEHMAKQVVEQWRDSIAEKEEEWPGDELPETALLTELLGGVMHHQVLIDEAMQGVIKDNWKPERMSPVMLALLRCAIYELEYCKDRKPAIILDEYVSIASGFFDDPELGFIHSALQRLAQTLRTPDLTEKDA